jgi:SOS-response transcriptional repressor LexA
MPIEPAGYLRTVPPMWRDNLRRILDQRGLDMKKVSKEAGLGETAVRDMLVGRVKEPGVSTLAKVADALNVSIGALLGESTYEERMSRYVKVVGSAAAGAWQEVTHQDFDVYEIPIPVDPKWSAGDLFALEVKGTSINRRARDGDWVLCLRTESAPRPIQSGDWVVVERIDNGRVETTIKQVRWGKLGWELWPDSNDPHWQNPTSLAETKDGIEVRVAAFVLDFVAAGTRF